MLARQQTLYKHGGAPTGKIPENAMNDLEGVEERPEYTFKNGAKYLGQWKGDMRHGKGV